MRWADRRNLRRGFLRQLRGEAEISFRSPAIFDEGEDEDDEEEEEEESGPISPFDPRLRWATLRAFCHAVAE
jgi:hypothetical protein